MIAFTRIKSIGAATEIAWRQAKDNGDIDESSRKSTEAPRRELQRALQALASPFLALCELPQSFGGELIIQSIAIDYEKDGRRGLVITARKTIAASNAPLMVHTPRLPETEDGGWPLEIPKLVQSVCAEAERFLNGEREQLTLSEELRP